MKLRFRGPKQPGVVTLDIPDEVPSEMLPGMLEDVFGVASERLVLATGFPPKPLTLDASAVQGLLRENDLIIVREGDATVKRGRTDGQYVPPCDDRSVMLRKEVPADNSCLFHAVAMIVAQPGQEGPALRQKCVEVVLAHAKDKFDAALLGQPPEQYALWLAQPTSWGGAVELVILSFLLQLELVVVDAQAGRTETFGAGEGYVTRGFVYYTGKHYDALAMVSSVTGKAQFLFNTRDERALGAARTLAQEKQKKQ